MKNRHERVGVSTASLLEWNLSLMGCGLGFGTLLGFEESHPLPWAPWWGGGVASFVCCARECVVGVGGCGG